MTYLCIQTNKAVEFLHHRLREAAQNRQGRYTFNNIKLIAFWGEIEYNKA